MQTIKINKPLNERCLRESRKRGMTKQEFIECALQYYLDVGMSVDDAGNHMDLFKSMGEIKDEVNKLRGAFFSYFKVHEAGYSMGTIKLLWLLKGYLDLLLHNSYFPINDSFLSADETSELMQRQLQKLKDIEQLLPPEHLWKVKSNESNPIASP